MTVAAIVPQTKQQPYNPYLCEVDDLIDELVAEEDLSPIEATSMAVGLLDELDAYVAVWNSMALLAGNNDAIYS